MANLLLGGPTTTFRDAVTNYLFNGAAAPAPATLYLGLATNAVAPGGTPSEAAGTGYARLALARDGSAWSRDVASGRLKTANTLTFNGGSALAANWGDKARSLVLYDAATGGNACYWFDVPDAAQPALTTGSPAPSVPAGQLSLL